MINTSALSKKEIQVRHNKFMKRNFCCTCAQRGARKNNSYQDIDRNTSYTVNQLLYFHQLCFTIVHG